MKRCSSCKKEVTDDYVELKCPNCGKKTITRCMRCRNIVAEYECPECGFKGP